MCGFFVVFDRRERVDEARFEAALSSMAHRGPDDARSRFEEIEANGRKVFVGFGHRRLSIIDLDERSSQPMCDSGVLTVFNGEIYNFARLRGAMQGQQFATTGDTEVLTRLVAKEGPAAFDSLIGQWASLHYFADQQHCLLARDFFGKKPLFVYHDEHRFIASSTIRAICLYLGRSLEWREDFLTSFLFSFGPYLPGDETHLHDLAQVPPGAVCKFDLGSWGLSVEHRLHNMGASGGASVEGAGIDLKDRRALFETVEQAVLDRLVSDRGVGLFVSGGVDSTLILAILDKNDCLDALTCVIGDTNGSPDAVYAKEVTAQLGVTPKVIPMDYSQESFSHLLEVCAHQERPFALNGNLVAMPQLYRQIEDTDIKVVLDGTGADEIFGGYWDRYFPFALRQAVAGKELGWLAGVVTGNVAQPARFRHAVRLALRGQQFPGYPDARELLGLDEAEFERIGLAFEPLGQIDCTLEEAQRADIFRGRLQDWLWQNDRNSMASSIEGRSPFMDRRLYPYLVLSDDAKFRGGFNKYALRQIFDHVGKLPTQWRRQKQGFPYSPLKFIASNKAHIIDLVEQDATITKHFPGLVADHLRRDDFSLPILGRLFSIAASAKAISV